VPDAKGEVFRLVHGRELACAILEEGWDKRFVEPVQVRAVPL
jgi:hypothetical protein